MKTKNKTIKKIIASGVAFVCACTAGIVGFATNWFGAGNVEGVEHNNYLSFGGFFGSGLSLTAASAETVDATSEGKTTLTATVTPEEMAPYILVDWSISWQDAASEWAMNKTVTDYVTITPETDGALTADVECKKAFGEKVVVKVSVRGHETIAAECVCDYQMRPDAFSAVLNSRETVFVKENYNTFTLNKTDEFSYETSFSAIGTGTVMNDEARYFLSYTLTDEFYTNLKDEFSEITANESVVIGDKSLEHGLSYLTAFHLPGIDYLSGIDQVRLSKAFEFVYELNNVTSVTSEQTEVYLKYRSAVAKTLNAGKDLIVITLKEGEDVNGNSFKLNVNCVADYLPEIVDSVSIAQTNILF